MKNLKSNCIIFSIGGVGYALLELLWRRRTHWTMAVTGGACFLSLFKLYRVYPNMKMILKCVTGSAIITSMEFICGCIVNLKYKLNVWDYSKCSYNLKGQICLLYSILWALLCVPVSFLCNKMSKIKYFG